MNGMQEAMARARCHELQRNADRYRQAQQLSAVRRWQRRATRALEQVEVLEQNAAASRGDFELVGR